MLCQSCKQNEASVHVTEVRHEFQPSTAPGVPAVSKMTAHQQHFCDACAQAAKLPHHAAKNVAEIWKLFQASQQPRSKREAAGAACPDCGMTLRDFRQRGRLGCPKDYEVFGTQLRDLLERIHGATEHVGRRPGDSADARRMQRITELRAALDVAIRDEAYEAAAKLRDELKSLQ
jgi:protein arginine kinase activator